MSEHEVIDQFNDPVRYRDGELPEEKAPSLLPYIPFGLRQTKISDIQSRSDLIRELTRQIPLNEFGLPQYYYRPDLLDKDMLIDMMERQQASNVDHLLQAAIFQISYGQGFPTQLDGNPIWGQLPWESKDAYDAFTLYLEQEGIRNLAGISAIALDVLTTWFDTNYWASRAKAYDVFRAAHHARIRENRIMNLENSHWIEGEKIFGRLIQAFGNKSVDDLTAMDPDKLISALERVTRIQRSAVGLSQTGKGSGEETPKVSSVEVVMRNIAGEHVKPAESEDFDTSLLADPEVLSMSQDLIIKVTK